MLALGLAVAGLVGWLWWTADESPPASNAAATFAPVLPPLQGHGPAASGAATQPSPWGDPNLAARPLTPDELRRMFLGDSSEVNELIPAGDWGVDAQDHPRFTAELQQRFDYYLSGLKLASLAELRAMMLDQAARDGLPERTRSELGELWDRHAAAATQR